MFSFSFSLNSVDRMSSDIKFEFLEYNMILLKKLGLLSSQGNPNELMLKSY